MNEKRRKFLQQASILTAGTLVLPNISCQSSSTNEENTTEMTNAETPSPTPSLSKFGIQLYTLREDMPKDPKGVLKQVAEMGYHQIESYEGDMGIFWGMSNTDFKSYINDLGMDIVSTHCEIKENFEEKAAQAAAIGIKYMVCPYIGAQKSMDDWKKIVDQFNTCGDICKQNGIRFAYHNHAYSFETLDGVIPQDYMMENTNPDTVDFELDIYWVVTGKADPIAYFEKYPNRFRLCHIKDRLKHVAEDEREASCDLGTGSIDYAKILKVAQDNGMKYYILEQERYDNSTPLKSAAIGAAYLKELIFSS